MLDSFLGPKRMANIGILFLSIIWNKIPAGSVLSQNFSWTFTVLFGQQTWLSLWNIMDVYPYMIQNNGNKIRDLFKVKLYTIRSETK